MSDAVFCFMALDTETKTVKQFSLKVTQSSKLNVNKSPEVGRGTDKEGMNVPLHMKKKKIILCVLLSVVVTSSWLRSAILPS